VLVTTANATEPVGPVWLGFVVLVGGTVCGTEVLVLGTVDRGMGVVVGADGPVVVVCGGGGVVGGAVVVGGVAVVVVVGDVVVVSADTASLSAPTTASELRQPPRTSTMVSRRAGGRSLGPTRRTDMGYPYPLVRSGESVPGPAQP
jgi:hypothetical protein